MGKEQTHFEPLIITCQSLWFADLTFRFGGSSQGTINWTGARSCVTAPNVTENLFVFAEKSTGFGSPRAICASRSRRTKNPFHLCKPAVRKRFAIQVSTRPESQPSL
ncbi:hypothetical protein AVEN_40415-1 [Araneus ventricosus]|uniref:Uncharacterized protein n=1 Tax=Araneus ventricosus TaxID=182803 RepID=A0A4Y2DBM4_ARAVE|nr:hypothetical protein AVEN_40415-1 [Araneus ventricosus]